jgi:hypothetical protein
MDMDRKSVRWKQKDILRVHVVACMIMYMYIGKNAQTWNNLDEQTKWATRDEHVQKTRKMEGKGRTGGVCSSM